jgi:hypothetical protein
MATHCFLPLTAIPDSSRLIAPQRAVPDRCILIICPCIVGLTRVVVLSLLAYRSLQINNYRLFCIRALGSATGDSGLAVAFPLFQLEHRSVTLQSTQNILNGLL